MEQVTMELVSGVVILTQHLNDSTNIDCTISLSVSVHSDDKKVNVKVSSSDLHPYPIEGVDVLSHLVKESFYLKQSTHSSMTRLLYNDYHDTSVVSVVELMPHSGTINQYTQPKPLLFPTLLIEATEVPLLMPTKEVPSILYQQLYLFRIINPQLSFTLSITLTPSEIIEYNFNGGQALLSILSSPFKLLSSIRHYFNARVISTDQMKLKVLRGVTSVLQGYSPNGFQQSVDLKLYSAISVIPELKITPGRKLPADRLCNQLHVYIFSSGNVPLIPSGGHANFSLQDIATWTDYGITVGPLVTERGRTHFHSGVIDDVPCVPSLSFQLRPCSHSSSLIATGNYAIHLFLFIEPVETSNDYSLTSTLLLINGLRNDFSSLVKSHAKRFQRTCHSALNKLFCNYSSFQKTKMSVSSSLPLLAEAVNDIIKSSQNQTFKTEAHHLLPCNEEDKMKLILDRLNHVAHSKIADKGPEEPSTPELMLAVSLPYSTTVHILPNDHNTTGDFDCLTHIDEDILPAKYSIELYEHSNSFLNTCPIELDSSIQSVPQDLSLRTSPNVDYTQSEHSIELYQHSSSLLHDNTQSESSIQHDSALSLHTFSIHSTHSIEYSSSLVNTCTQSQCSDSILHTCHPKIQIDSTQYHSLTNEQMVPELTNSDQEWDNNLIMSPLPEAVINSCLTSPPVSESDFKWD